MPVAVPTLGSFNYVAETKASAEKLPWADLVTVDLSLYHTPKGRKQLAETLIRAVREKGFFYVKNFGVSQEAVNRQFAIGKAFYDLPLEEKMRYVPDNFMQGGFNGYMPAGRIVVDPNTGLKDKVEVYNIPKFNGDFTHSHPAPVSRNLAEIEEFVRTVQTKIVEPLLTLVAIALELPEDYLRKLHQYEVKSEDHIRHAYMKCSKHPTRDNERLAAWVPGHTDLGSFTLLFRQPVAGLQISDPVTDEWKWVKPQDAMLTVNTCDALQLLTGGYVRSTIHRVHPPPRDQQHVDRLGLLYFSRPHNDVKLATIQDSPVLLREGYTKNPFEASGNPVPTMEEWTFAKQKWQRTGYLGPERASKEVLPGFPEKVYT
ncbi:Clavaminate synthase-like protein [Mycena belliarum]|uniref:Clavaminate synthase-like protein n=1 Tax=Mycena belliarum TaxID=1033014 RepID=A0AAD6U054_9AGAR|nr:Clavaminate synthase-like protein [Mycena belliae]